jgi:hypothetical protein
MKVRVDSGRLSPRTLFKPVSVSFFIGAGLLGGGLLLLGFALTPAPAREQLNAWVVIAFFPLALVAQALIVAALVVFGAWLYSRFRTIEVVNDESKL